MFQTFRGISFFIRVNRMMMQEVNTASHVAGHKNAVEIFFPFTLMKEEIPPKN